MRRPGHGAWPGSAGRRERGQGTERIKERHETVCSQCGPAWLAAAVTIEPYECPDTAPQLPAARGSWPRWPGSALVCGPGPDQRATESRGHEPTSAGSRAGRAGTRAGTRGRGRLSLEATLAAAGAAHETRGQGSLIRGGCHRPRSAPRPGAEQPPVTRHQRPCSLAQPRPGLGLPGLAPASSVRG